MSSIYGLIGEKLSHSLSPQIHSLIFRELNLDNFYHLFEVKKENLRDCILGLKALGIRGVNVTIPYKVQAMDFLDVISDEARSIGAINTIHFKDDKAWGYNTDYYGFGMTLKRYDIDVEGKSAVILGSGGASKAVVQYLVDNHIGEITIASRNPLKIKDEFKNIGLTSYDNISSMTYKDIIINCTPCGMYPNTKDTPLKKEEIAKFRTAVDLIYNPQETVFLRYAKENGIKAVNGLNMLVGQAVKSEELWNGLNIRNEAVDKIYDEVLRLI